MNVIRVGHGVCPFCNEQHEALGLDVDSECFLYACPNLPENTLFVDVEFPQGPRGVLYRLGEMQRAEWPPGR